MSTAPQKVDGETLDRITKSREVLYSDNHSGADYVATYTDFWAQHYNEDGIRLGFMAWDHAANAVARFLPDRSAPMLDFCGGTGQVGARLSSIGFTDLHVADGSTEMLKQAVGTGAYRTAMLGVCERDRLPKYLEESDAKFACVLSSMSLAEYRLVTEHIVTKTLKIGGVFISLEAEPHIEKANLDGLKWILEHKNDKNCPFEVLLDDNTVPHDKFTDDKMRLIVVKRIK